MRNLRLFPDERLRPRTARRLNEAPTGWTRSDRQGRQQIFPPRRQLSYFFWACWSLAQASLRVTVRLKTGAPGALSFTSAQK
jgi:hypothetical protein